MHECVWMCTHLCMHMCALMEQILKCCNHCGWGERGLVSSKHNRKKQLPEAGKDFSIQDYRLVSDLKREILWSLDTFPGMNYCKLKKTFYCHLLISIDLLYFEYNLKEANNESPKL